MIFNSLTYLLLLIFVVILYWFLPYRARLLLIFSASLTFYGFWRFEFVPLLLFSAAIDWWCSRLMTGQPNRHRLLLLIFSCSVNLLILFYFKYLIFFSNNAIGLANIFDVKIDPIMLNIILPLGISFYTFQTISYTVDVYRKVIDHERDFLLYGCYVTFFPQLIAGPILRAGEVINQFKKPVIFSFDHISVGIRRVLYGLFLKVVLADNISPLVDAGYAMPLETMSALDVWTLAFLFGFQIYFDFSGYSHIAFGSARMIGIVFPENFNFPYLASSPRDFWRRWHISLSSWIRDYLYLPLVGVKIKGSSIGGIDVVTIKRKHSTALFFTWIIMGLWHGANWTFLLWGIFHAMFISLYRIVEPRSRGFSSNLRRLVGFCITLPVTMIAWVPFRAESIDTTFVMWAKLFQPSAYAWLGMRENTYLITMLILLGFFLTYAIRHLALPMLQSKQLVITLVDILTVAVMFALVIVFLRPISQFIYFQF